MRFRMAATALVIAVVLSLSCAAGEEDLPGYTDVDTDQVSELLSGDFRDELFLLDVRQQDEYEEGHMEGAVLIPLGQLENRLSEIDRSKAILVICWSGFRSALAAATLVDAGFDRVLNYTGGMSAWDGPVLTGSSQPTARITAVSGEVEICRSGTFEFEPIPGIPTFLYELDKIRTGPESGGSLLFSNGTTVLLHELSVVEIVEPADATGGFWRRLRVFLGEIFVTADPTDQQIDFETPNVIASVRGTAFDIAVFADHLQYEDVSLGFSEWCARDVFTTEVTTLSGTVRVANELGDVDVSEGETVRVRQRERPGSPEKTKGSTEGRPEWVRRLQQGDGKEGAGSSSPEQGSGNRSSATGLSKGESESPVPVSGSGLGGGESVIGETSVCGADGGEVNLSPVDRDQR